MSTISLKNLFGYFIVFLFGIFLGWYFFSSKSLNVSSDNFTSNGTEIWACSLHPDIRKAVPGKCPFCNLDLVRLKSSDVNVESGEVHFANTAEELKQLATSVIGKQSANKEIAIYGKVQADEKVIQRQKAEISGRIDKMMIGSTGTRVTKGQVLALVYSPEFVAAQQELLDLAPNKKTDPESYNAVKNRLKKFGFSDAQILEIESRDRVAITTEVVSNITGVITARLVNDGEYVKKGSVLYEVADLSKVWIVFDAYEGDLPFLRKGDPISFTCKAMPSTTFNGNIQFVDSVMDPVSHVAKLRVEFDNQRGLLKPDMHATGIVHANLSNYKDRLVVPQSAVLWKDNKAYVYIKHVDNNETVFNVRNITLGVKVGDSYLITDGLNEGEEVILQGASSLNNANK